MDTPSTLPDEIEIFRPGRHIDDQGGVHEFSDADVDAMVAAYDPALREAPLTVGHPADNLPAYGWVSGLARNAAGRLVMNTHQVLPQFAEWVGKRMYKKRSASFYPPNAPNNPKPGSWYLRHVAFLGAQPPAIAGLADFADSAAGAVSFSEGDPAPSTQEHRTMTEEEKAAIARAEQAERDAAAARAETEQARAQLAQFAEQQRQARHAGHVSFAEAEVKAGRLLPKDQAAAVAVLDMLADTQPVEFAEAGATKKLAAVDWLKNLISGGKPVVQFGEFGGQPAPVTEGMTDADIDKRAKAYAAQHNVSYAEALGKVTTFTA
ncbi:hypothetical protein GO613_12685 [Azoarcus communis]|uniref:hypothetical protein n=1 Tax=Parazoarcus communis TaxID=41977 RepID=UPI0014591D55|nr:hypothetical protein [Parazoarcus communis]NMG48957.1 hypothetical protein [Parazoarcus communis]